MATTFKTPFGMNPNKTNLQNEQNINNTAVSINTNNGEEEFFDDNIQNEKQNLLSQQNKYQVAQQQQIQNQNQYLQQQQPVQMSNQQQLYQQQNQQQVGYQQLQQQQQQQFNGTNVQFGDQLEGNINLTEQVRQAQIIDGELMDEPPLLEDLGIDLENIKQKTLSVLTFKKCDEKFINEADMSGPILLALLLGSLMLLSGKVHFGYIYGFGLCGCLGIYVVMNLLSQEKFIELYNTTSILGYSLLPTVILAAIGVFINLNGILGIFLSTISIIWSTYNATYFFQEALKIPDRKWLIAFPTLLFYAAFILITIF